MVATDLSNLSGPDRAPLLAAGFAESEVGEWAGVVPSVSDDFDADRIAHSAFWQQGAAFLQRLPSKPNRSEAEGVATAEILRCGKDSRDAFLSRHARTLYDRLTAGRTRFLRVEALLAAAADQVPGLTPDAEALAHEAALPLNAKDGLEKDQGLVLAHALADHEAGTHLIHAMLLPKPESLERFDEFDRTGRADLGAAVVERHGAAVVVEMRNSRYLNAIDWTTIGAVETVVDLAILDRQSGIAVLRGGFVEHPKYAGRRIFSAGINLTHLYQGKIPFLFYFHHLMGFEHKMLRGLARPDASPDDMACATDEKAWMATVDTFAIGGGCQHLLVMDYVLAGADAYLTLPARKEGIIPGAANLRLPRLVGDRIARQAILHDRRFECDSPDGRQICDEIVPAGDMDAALERAVAGYATSGVVSIVSNRRQLRIGQEPLDLFRRYMAQHAREQAECHFSKGLIDNLERYWDARNR